MTGRQSPTCSAKPSAGEVLRLKWPGNPTVTLSQKKMSRCCTAGEHDFLAFSMQKSYYVVNDNRHVVFFLPLLIHIQRFGRDAVLFFRTQFLFWSAWTRLDCCLCYRTPPCLARYILTTKKQKQKGFSCRSADNADLYWY